MKNPAKIGPISSVKQPRRTKRSAEEVLKNSPANARAVATVLDLTKGQAARKENTISTTKAPAPTTKVQAQVIRAPVTRVRLNIVAAGELYFSKLLLLIIENNVFGSNPPLCNKSTVTIITAGYVNNVGVFGQFYERFRINPCALGRVAFACPLPTATVKQRSSAFQRR